MGASPFRGPPETERPTPIDASEGLPVCSSDTISFRALTRSQRHLCAPPDVVASARSGALRACRGPASRAASGDAEGQAELPLDGVAAATRRGARGRSAASRGGGRARGPGGCPPGTTAAPAAHRRRRSPPWRGRHGRAGQPGPPVVGMHGEVPQRGRVVRREGPETVRTVHHVDAHRRVGERRPPPVRHRLVRVRELLGREHVRQRDQVGGALEVAQRLGVRSGGGAEVAVTGGPPRPRRGGPARLGSTAPAGRRRPTPCEGAAG